jgi:dUTP pyrophosphatase
VSENGRRVRVAIQRLPHAPDELPHYETAGSAGMDLRLASADVHLQPGERILLPTGFAIALPPGYEGQIRLRSGFALRKGLILLNAPGTIDSDYRGELKVLVMNVGREAVIVEQGERFAQLIIAPVAVCEWTEAKDLPGSERGAGGFGSTGRN